MTTIKKIWKYLCSMQFAILLLALLALACALSSLVTQGQSAEWYRQQYSERTAALILALHLDDAFHSWWFLLLGAFLCCNLLLCNLLRAPRIWRQYRREGQAESVSESTSADSFRTASPEPIFRRMRMPAPKRGTAADGKKLLFSAANRIGLWGAWVCHLGILLLILGFGLGQMLQQEYTVYGVPGQIKQIGETGYYLGVDDFRIDLREDESVEQFTSALTVYDLREGGSGESASAEASVNHPARIFGMKLYQNSTGWAATVRILEKGEPVQEEPLCVGELLPVANRPELVVYFNAFYPNLVLQQGGVPTTAGTQPNNPGYLYSVYYKGQIIGMNVLRADESIIIDDYEVSFSEPRSYTLIQIKRDPYTPLALLGGLVTMAGLFLAFYLQPKKLWAVRDEDGVWTVCGSSRKGGAIFREQFRAAAREMGAEPVTKGEETHASD